MSKIETLQNNLVQQIYSIHNKKLLNALEMVIEASGVKTSGSKLSGEQLQSIKEGEKDFENGEFISQAELDRLDEEWLG